MLTSGRLSELLPEGCWTKLVHCYLEHKTASFAPCPDQKSIAFMDPIKHATLHWVAGIGGSLGPDIPKLTIHPCSRSRPVKL